MYAPRRRLRRSFAPAVSQLTPTPTRTPVLRTPQMIRDAFELAREKSKDRGGAIIFIDEVRSARGG